MAWDLHITQTSECYMWNGYRTSDSDNLRSPWHTHGWLCDYEICMTHPLRDIIVWDLHVRCAFEYGSLKCIWRPHFLNMRIPYHIHFLILYYDQLWPPWRPSFRIWYFEMHLPRTVHTAITWDLHDTPISANCIWLCIWGCPSEYDNLRFLGTCTSGYSCLRCIGRTHSMIWLFPIFMTHAPLSILRLCITSWILQFAIYITHTLDTVLCDMYDAQNYDLRSNWHTYFGLWYFKMCMANPSLSMLILNFHDIRISEYGSWDVSDAHPPRYNNLKFPWRMHLCL